MFCNITNPRISLFPLTSSREKFRFSANEIHCSPRGHSLSVHGWPVTVFSASCHSGNHHSVGIGGCKGRGYGSDGNGSSGSGSLPVRVMLPLVILVRVGADASAGVDAREVVLELMLALNFQANWQPYLKCVLQLPSLCSVLFCILFHTY